MQIIKLIVAATTALVFLASNTYACDESCERAKLADKKLSFPSYVTWSYCEEIREEFMTTAMSSVGNYITNKLNPKYKGSVRNTRKFLSDRKEWVQECSSYMQATNKGYIFDTKEKTEQIYALVDSVLFEFDGILKGVSQSTSLDNSTSIIKQKYDTLFQTVDDHRNLMHLRGKYVYR